MGKRPNYEVVDGVRLPGFFNHDFFREAMAYRAKRDDLFIVTFSKCGTTWLQNVVLYILRKGEELEEPLEFFDRCPFIDLTGKKGIEKMPRPGAFKTHLPFNYVPYSPEAKYIFVTRNPKDCCVSLYHHTRSIPGYQFWDGDFDDFFEVFLAGEVEFNGYFDHILSWYPYRNDPNAFCVTYESLKEDLAGVVLKLAKFLGEEYADAIAKDSGVLRNILRFSSMEYMRKYMSVALDCYMTADMALLEDPHTPEGLAYAIERMNAIGIPKDRPMGKFFRKGIVGDWKNHFTEEQSDRIVKKFLDVTEGTEIPHWFQMD